MQDNSQKKGRGWIMDELLRVGHLEAELSHNDERIQKLRQDIDDASSDVEKMTKLADRLGWAVEYGKMIYNQRVRVEQGIFAAFGEEIDEERWCNLKHRLTEYVIAAENYHAREHCGASEDSMVEAGRLVAFLCSITFGFEPMNCLRCLDEKLKSLDSTPAPVSATKTKRGKNDAK